MKENTWYTCGGDNIKLYLIQLAMIMWAALIGPGISFSNLFLGTENEPSSSMKLRKYLDFLMRDFSILYQTFTLCNPFGFIVAIRRKFKLYIIAM
jgi:hypothetical protein